MDGLTRRALNQNRTIARLYVDITDAFHRLADGLGGLAGSSEAGRAARDLATLFGQLSDLSAVWAANAEATARSRDVAHAYIADLLGPDVDTADEHGRLPGADHYGCPEMPCPRDCAGYGPEAY